MMRFLKAWRLAQMRRKYESLQLRAQEYRIEATALALKAYHMDQFETPMMWGRTQNAANWSRRFHHTCLKQAQELERKIAELEGRPC